VTTTDLLAHRKGKVVTIAVADLEPGSSSVRYLDESPGDTAQMRVKVPLGHKVAPTDISSGADRHGVRPADRRGHQSNPLVTTSTSTT